MSFEGTIAIMPETQTIAPRTADGRHADPHGSLLAADPHRDPRDGIADADERGGSRGRHRDRDRGPHDDDGRDDDRADTDHPDVPPACPSRLIPSAV